MPPKKGQRFNRYDEETIREAVRLRLEEQWIYSMIMEKLGIKSESQIVNWVAKHQNGESLEDYRGRWIKKHFSSVEEENNYLKAHVEYLKKLNPNLHGEESWINKPGMELVLDTVKQLDATDTILHSDQGFQYTTKSYSNVLQEIGLTGSHSRSGNCFDNACIESFFSYLKTEKLYLEKPKDIAHARKLIAEYIEYYNNERFQKKLGDLSPVEYREAIAA